MSQQLNVENEPCCSIH